MPTYQYACTACDERLEVVQSFTDDALTTCPACGGRLRKVFSAAGIIFKGSGFYRTDSRASSKSALNGADKKADSTESTSESKSSDGKTAKSAETAKSSGGSGSGSSTSSASEKVA